MGTFSSQYAEICSSQLQDATENDASNGSGEENTNVDLSANLGSLKVSRGLHSFTWRTDSLAV